MKIRSIYTAIFLFVFITIYSWEDGVAAISSMPIDRHALVTRHNISWNEVNGQIPLGNGRQF